MKEYFSDKELNCRCGCGLTIGPQMRELLNKLREEYGKPIYVISGARCEGHNRSVGGVSGSRHTKGRAVDLVRTEPLLAFLKARIQMYGFSMEDPASTATWLHIDLDQRNGKWGIFKP